MDYTAKVKDNGEIFQTTREADAKTSSIYDANVVYRPRIISVGESWILKAVDDALLNANVGDKLIIEVLPEKAFGVRDSRNVRMIPFRKLGEDAEKVTVGDTIEVDGKIGIVRFIGSGRVQIDYNHRLAGKTILYDVNIVKSLDTDNEKILGLLKRHIPLDESKLQFKLNGTQLDITVPDEIFSVEGLHAIKRNITTDIFKFVPNLQKINLVESYNNTKAEKPQAKVAESKAAESKPVEPKAA